MLVGPSAEVHRRRLGQASGRERRQEDVFSNRASSLPPAWAAGPGRVRRRPKEGLAALAEATVAAGGGGKGEVSGAESGRWGGWVSGRSLNCGGDGRRTGVAGGKSGGKERGGGGGVGCQMHDATRKITRVFDLGEF